MLALCGIIAIATAIALGIPNPPKSISLAGYESRLISPNTAIYGFILLSDPEGGVNSFIMSKPPSTYVVPATLEQDFSLPRGHFKYWVRHVNAGSRLKMKVTWAHDISLKGCLTMSSVESYMKDSSSCLVQLTSRSQISFEYVTKHAGDHYFIVESSSEVDTTAPTTAREPLSISSKTEITSTIVPSQRVTQSVQGEKNDASATKRLLDMHSSDSIEISSRGPQSRDDSASPSSKSSRQLKGLDLLANGEQPDFIMVRGNVSFEMALIQYDTNQADDLFVGTFSKDFEFNRPEWLVMYNPSDTRIFSITLSLSRRYKELLIAFFLIEFVLLSTISGCCYFRYSSVPLKRDAETGMRLFSRKNKARHLGDARSRSLDNEEEPENPWDWPPSASSPEPEERRTIRRVALSSGAAVPLFSQ